MKTTIIAAAIAALASTAATPALAHCGGTHGKSYRAAQSKAPAAGKAAVATKPAPRQGAPASGPAPTTMLTTSDGAGATF